MPAIGWLLPGSAAGAVAGILIADPAAPPPAAIGTTCLLAVTAGVLSLLVGALARRSGLGLGALVLGAASLGLAAGAWRAGAVSLPTGPGSVAAAAVRAGDADLRVIGTVVDDPRPKEDRQQVILEAVTLDGRSAPGRVLVWLPRAIGIGSGDRLAFNGRLEQPEDFDGFPYRAYLARQGIGAVARTFEGEVLAHGAAGPAALAAGMRRTLLDGLDRIIPEPEAALGAGILLGVRTSIDPGTMPHSRPPG